MPGLGTELPFLNLGLIRVSLSPFRERLLRQGQRVWWGHSSLRAVKEPFPASGKLVGSYGRTCQHLHLQRLDQGSANMGQIQLAHYFYIDFELRVIFTFLIIKKIKRRIIFSDR